MTVDHKLDLADLECGDLAIALMKALKGINVNNMRELLNDRDQQTVYLNPDCGFGTFADRPVNTTEIAQKKLEAIARAAGELRKGMKYKSGHSTNIRSID